MMSSDNLVSEVRELLPFQKIESDIRLVLSEANHQVHLDDEIIEVKPHVDLEIAYRYFIDDSAGLSLSQYKVCVAIGKIEKSSFGAISAEYCFAFLHYDLETNLVTIDFEKSIH